MACIDKKYTFLEHHVGPNDVFYCKFQSHMVRRTSGKFGLLFSLKLSNLSEYLGRIYEKASLVFSCSFSRIAEIIYGFSRGFQFMRWFPSLLVAVLIGTCVGSDLCSHLQAPYMLSQSSSSHSRFQPTYCKLYHMY